VNLSLFLATYHAVNMFKGVKVQFHKFLTSTLGGGDLSASLPCQGTYGTPLIGWVGPRAGLDSVAKRNIP